ncbi:alcohol oxidase [Teratosphaeria destructans]|uniref:Alcohol oxidase n=1 Tax=Teratosphaeria destructans TaxID=418781 RepID=A0A9W7VZQ4_9PEZI|nr:alcohol oxidase [Teratosphaeria destructans]
MVGGSSAINSFAMIYPNQAGIDIWGKVGNFGWSWPDLEPYFRRFQTLCEPDAGFDQKIPIVSPTDEALDGPIQASLPMRSTALHGAWVETFRNLGLENRHDPLKGQAIGGYISTCHISADRRERSHAGNAYLNASTMDKENLIIMTDALVQRVEFRAEREKSDLATATGVWYRRNGALHFVRASKEVILAAGALSSPAILERSGIGSPSLLARHGVKLVYANGNVGENLQDHIRAGLSFRAAPNVEPSEPEDPEEARRQYQRDRTGPWAEHGCWTFAHLPILPFLSPREEDMLRQKIIKLLDASNSGSLSMFERQHIGYVRDMVLSRQEATSTTFLSRQPASAESRGGPHEYISLFSMLSHPLSRGHVHITSCDASAPPEIDCKYYSHPLDLEIHARHLQVLGRIAASLPLRNHVLPGGHVLPLEGDVETLEGAKHVCRKYARTNYHPCGSCAMMPENAGGVVTDQLRVYGTRNVRVIDSSIFPVIPRGNIVTTVYAVAEKAADIMSETWTTCDTQHGPMRRRI